MEEVQTAEVAGEEAEAGKVGVGGSPGPFRERGKCLDGVSVGGHLRTSLKFYSRHKAG